MSYQVFIKDQQTATDPTTYWPTRELAAERIPVLEKAYLSLRGQLEVREVEHEVEG